MSIVLLRVDERLIHGQVIVGWGSQLHPDRIVVVDDAIAESDWEQELYTIGLPPDLQASFVTVEQARDHIGEWRESGERVIVLTRDIGTMQRLAEGGLLSGDEVNIGGIHYSADRRPVLPYVYLSDAEAAALDSLAREGVNVTARDLPGARRVPLSDLLRSGRT